MSFALCLISVAFALLVIALLTIRRSIMQQRAKDAKSRADDALRLRNHQLLFDDALIGLPQALKEHYQTQFRVIMNKMAIPLANYRLISASPDKGDADDKLSTTRYRMLTKSFTGIVDDIWHVDHAFDKLLNHIEHQRKGMSVGARNAAFLLASNNLHLHKDSLDVLAKAFSTTLLQKSHDDLVKMAEQVSADIQSTDPEVAYTNALAIRLFAQEVQEEGFLHVEFYGRRKAILEASETFRKEIRYKYSQLKNLRGADAAKQAKALQDLRELEASIPGYMQMYLSPNKSHDVQIGMIEGIVIMIKAIGTQLVEQPGQAVRQSASA